MPKLPYRNKKTLAVKILSTMTMTISTIQVWEHKEINF